ncbi:MAG: hypothetical protein WC915_03330 [archaeon]|jgi:hypothetical protein
MAPIKLLQWFKTRREINKVAKLMNTPAAHASKGSERWHEPTARKNIQTHILSIGFKKSKMNSQLSNLILDLDHRVEKDGFKVIDEFLEQHKSTINKKELISELKDAKQQINLFVDNAKTHNIPQRKKETYTNVKSGINNLSNGPISYIDLIIDYLERKK